MDDNALHELTAPYALDALDAGEARAYEQHLSHCERCQEELARLSAGAAALGFAAPPSEPPPALRERILDAARAERPNVVPLRPRRTLSPVTALAAAACAAAVGLGIWNVVLHDELGDSRGALRSVPLTGAAGSVVVGPGGEGTLVVTGLRRAPAGKTYEAWVIHGGKAQPAGLFRGGGTSTVHLRRPLPRGAVVGVTVERAGGVEQPTAEPIVTSAAV